MEPPGEYGSGIAFRGLQYIHLGDADKEPLSDAAPAYELRGLVDK
jgi:hypothetical protein